MDIAVTYPEFATFMWSKKLLENANFAELASNEGFPQGGDLIIMTMGCTVAISVFRFVFDFILSASASLSNRVKSAERPLPMQSPELEKLYQQRRLNLPDINEVKILSTKLRFSVEEINKWFQIKQRMDRNRIKTKRFREGVWRLLMYSICFCYGLSLARKEPWYHDTKLCWVDILTVPMGEELKIFYICLQLPLYLHLSLYELMDSRKSNDTWEMTSHHIVAALLLILSFLGNFSKIGTLCLLYHDVTDLFLESTKIFNYLKWTGFSNMLFFGLVICWGYSRLYKFTSVILYSVFVEAVEMDVFGTSFYAFAGLLLVILGLNIFWFYAIGNMAYRILWAGTEEVRERAMTDLSTDDEYDSDDSTFRSDSEFSTDSKKYN